MTWNDSSMPWICDLDSSQSLQKMNKYDKQSTSAVTSAQTNNVSVSSHEHYTARSSTKLSFNDVAKPTIGIEIDGAYRINNLTKGARRYVKWMNKRKGLNLDYREIVPQVKQEVNRPIITTAKYQPLKNAIKIIPNITFNEPEYTPVDTSKKVIHLKQKIESKFSPCSVKIKNNNLDNSSTYNLKGKAQGDHIKHKSNPLVSFFPHYYVRSCCNYKNLTKDSQKQFDKILQKYGGVFSINEFKLYLLKFDLKEEDKMIDFSYQTAEDYELEVLANEPKKLSYADFLKKKATIIDETTEWKEWDDWNVVSHPEQEIELEPWDTTSVTSKQLVSEVKKYAQSKEIQPVAQFQLTEEEKEIIEEMKDVLPKSNRSPLYDMSNGHPVDVINLYNFINLQPKSEHTKHFRRTKSEYGKEILRELRAQNKMVINNAIDVTYHFRNASTGELYLHDSERKDEIDDFFCLDPRNKVDSMFELKHAQMFSVKGISELQGSLDVTLKKVNEVADASFDVLTGRVTTTLDSIDSLSRSSNEFVNNDLKVTMQRVKDFAKEGANAMTNISKVQNQISSYLTNLKEKPLPVELIIAEMGTFFFHYDDTKLAIYHYTKSFFSIINIVYNHITSSNLTLLNFLPNKSAQGNSYLDSFLEMIAPAGKVQSLFMKRCTAYNTLCTVGRNIKCSINVIRQCFLDILRFLFPRFIQAGTFYENEDYKRWVRSCSAIHNAFNIGDKKTFKRLIKNVDDLIVQGEKFLEEIALAVVPSNIGTEIRNMMKNLIVYWKLKENALQNSGIRITPFGIVIKGGTNIGKSAVAHVITQLLSRCVGASDEELYTRSKSSDFWDGYAGQFGILYDDFGQAVDFAEVPEIFDVISSTPWIPPQASLDNVNIGIKGTFLTSEVVIATSNLDNFNSTTTVIHAPEALQRRFCCDITCIPSGGAKNVNFDHLLFNVSFHEGAVHSRLNFFEMCKVVSTQFKKHHIIQSQLKSEGGFKSTIDTLTSMFVKDYQPPEDFLDAQMCSKHSQSKIDNLIRITYNCWDMLCGKTWRLFNSNTWIVVSGVLGISSITYLVSNVVMKLIDQFCSNEPDYPTARYEIKGDAKRLVSEVHDDLCHRCRNTINKAAVERGIQIRRVVGILKQDKDHCELFFEQNPKATIYDYLFCDDKAVTESFTSKTVFSKLPKLHTQSRSLDISKFIKFCDLEGITIIDAAVTNDGEFLENALSNVSIDVLRKYLKMFTSKYQQSLISSDKSGMIESSLNKLENIENNEHPVLRKIRDLTMGKKAEGFVDSNAANVENFLAARLVSIRRESPKLATVNAIPIFSNYLLVPRHFFYPGDKFVKTNYEFEYLNVNYNMLVEEEDLYPLQGDAVLLRVRNYIPQFKDIRKWFISEKELPYVNGLDSLYTTLLTLKDNSILRYCISDARLDNEHHYDDSLGVSHYITRSITYNANTQAGDCGSPLIAHSPNIIGKILGIHVFGTNSLMPMGGSMLVTSEMLFSTSAKDMEHKIQRLKYVQNFEIPASHIDFPHKNYFHIASLPEFAPSVPSRTQLEFSKTGDFFSPIYKTPSNLSRESVLIGASKYSGNNFELDPQRLDKVVNSVAEHLKQLPYIGNKKILTTLEALDKYGALEALNLSTSPGFPWTYEKKTKRDLLDNTNGNYIIKSIELEKAIKFREEQYLNNIIPFTIWITTPKDELLKPGKKTRVFEIGPVDHTIVGRKYFGAFIDFFHSFHCRFFSTVGINPESNEWSIMFKQLLANSRYGFGTDWEGYDGSVLAQLIMAAISVVNKWYDDSFSNVREIIGLECILRFTFVCDKLVLASHGVPSGFFLTTIINTLINYIIHVYCYLTVAPVSLCSYAHFRKNVVGFFYGDDSIVSVKPDVLKFFNTLAISNIMKKVGMTIQADKKDGNLQPYVDILTLTFLKRSTFTNGLLYIPILDMITMLTMLQYVRKCKHLTTQQRHQQVLDSFFSFAYFYGRDFFNFFRSHFINLYNIPDFDYYDSLFFTTGSLPCQFQ